MTQTTGNKVLLQVEVNKTKPNMGTDINISLLLVTGFLVKKNQNIMYHHSNMKTEAKLENGKIF